MSTAEPTPKDAVCVAADAYLEASPLLAEFLRQLRAGPDKLTEKFVREMARSAYIYGHTEGHSQGVKFMADHWQRSIDERYPASKAVQS